jgi:hypothetical protein
MGGLRKGSYQVEERPNLPFSFLGAFRSPWYWTMRHDGTKLEGKLAKLACKLPF